MDPVDAILWREVDAVARAGERTVVLDDVTGGLVRLARRGGDQPLRVHCDLLSDEQRVRQVATTERLGLEWHSELSADLLTGAEVVVLRLPKSLAALDEIAEAVAAFGEGSVRLVAGARVKHMTRGMNRVLLRHFGSVRASLGQQKSRVLIASAPRPGARPSYPRCRRLEDDLAVCAHGAVFAGPTVDQGTALLAAHLDQLPSDAAEIVDLGCGTGVLAALLARSRPKASVRAVDESAAACRSAAATAISNDVADRVVVQRLDVLAGVADASLDAVVCNPPFHRGSARDSDAASRMFADAGRALKPTGELWCVYNSHLPYLTWLRRTVGRTVVVAQNPQFTLTRSVPTASRA